MDRSSRLARRIVPACLVVTLLLALAAAERAPERVVAVADVHGAYTQLVALLQRTRLIDGNRQWIGGAATFVQTGDVLDRGARSRECLDLLMALERQAATKGGKVIPLLGNHEVMNVMGDLRFVTQEIYGTFATAGSEKKREQAYKDYLKFLSAHEGHAHTATPPVDEVSRRTWMDEHPSGFVEYRDAFAPNGTYGRWLRRHHAVVQIGDGVFVHGGLSPTLAFGSVRELDDRVTAELAAFDRIWHTLVDRRLIWRHMKLTEALRFAGEELNWLQAGGTIEEPETGQPMLRLLGYTSWMASSPEGPLWYRGLATEPEDTLIDGVKAMLQRLQAHYIVVGHTVESTADITPRVGNRVFLLDTGMLKDTYGGRASALEIQNGRFTAHYVDGEPRALPAPASVKTVSPGLQRALFAFPSA